MEGAWRGEGQRTSEIKDIVRTLQQLYALGLQLPRLGLDEAPSCRQLSTCSISQRSCVWVSASFTRHPTLC